MNIQVRERGGASHTGQRFYCNNWKRLQYCRYFPVAHEEDDGGAESHTAGLAGSHTAVVKCALKEAAVCQMDPQQSKEEV